MTAALDPSRAIVRVLGERSATAGAGFLVSDDGLVATCAHVVEDAGVAPAGDVALVFLAAEGDPEHGVRQARVERAFWRDREAEDVAFLRVVGAVPANAAPAGIGASVRAEERQAVLRGFGFPEATPVEGMSAKIELTGRTTQSGYPVLQARSNEVSFGFSGAPVWDADYQVVVGMVDSIISASTDPGGRQTEVAFIRPAETLWTVCPLLHPAGMCPYRGLHVFEETDADLYFGRDLAAAELVHKLGLLDFVAIVGVSGSGKSSLARAGLAKALRRSPVPGLSERARCSVKPGAFPLLDLAVGLAGVHGASPAIIEAALALSQGALGHDAGRREAGRVLDKRSPDGIAASVRNIFRTNGLLLLVDQFERLFTECADEERRRRFVEALLALAGEDVKVLVTLRADFYGLALGQPGLAERIKGGQLTLLPMSDDELLEAIEEPAWAQYRTFEPGLPERLVSDVRGRVGDLPLLEFALTELWRKDAEGGVLAASSYEALGYEGRDGKFPGVQGAVVRHAEDVWRGLSDEERSSARRVFLSLVSAGSVVDAVGEASVGASRRAWRLEWDERTQSVVDRLVDARLVTTGQDAFSGQPTVEVAHEALIRAWPRLRGWVERFHPFMRWYEHDLTPYLRRWIESGKKRDFLLPEAMVGEARVWLEEYPDELAGFPAKFVRLSSEALETERRRLANERDQLERALGEAKHQHNVALARQLAAQSEVLRPSAELLERSVLLAAESLCRLPAAEGDQALRRGLRLLARPLVRVADEGLCVDISVAPSGKWLATLGIDGSVRVWDTASWKEIHRLPDSKRASAVEFLGDGLLLVVGRSSIRLWNLNERRTVAHVEGMRRQGGVAGDERGDRLVTGSGEGLAVWDTAAGQRVRRLTTTPEHYSAKVVCVAMSADGRMAAAGCVNASTHVWDVESAEEVFFRPGIDYVEMVEENLEVWVEGVGLSADGALLVTACERAASVFLVETGREVTRLDHGGHVTGVDLSASGALLATATHLRTAHVWELPSGREISRVSAPETPVTLALGQGRFLVTRGVESYQGRMWKPPYRRGTVRVWALGNGDEAASVGDGGSATAVAIAPDASLLATGGPDGGAHVWEAATGRELAATPHVHWSDGLGRAGDSKVTDLGFSADSRWLVVMNEDGGARRFAIETGRWELLGREVLQGLAGFGIREGKERFVGPPLGDRGEIDDFWMIMGPGGVLSGNGRVYAANLEGIARVWDVETGVLATEFKHRLKADAYGRLSLALSFDGAFLAAASISEGSCRVRVWELARQRVTGRLSLGSSASAVAISPDSGLVAVASGSAVAIWDAAQGKQIAQLRPNADVAMVAFAPDGATIATAGGDGRAQVWEARSGWELARVEHGAAVIAVKFSPDGALLASCAEDGNTKFSLWRSGDLVAEACRRVRRNLTLDEWRQYFDEEPYRTICPESRESQVIR